MRPRSVEPSAFISTILLALFLTLSDCAHLTVTIPATNILQNPSLLAPSTQATLFRLSHTLSAPITRRNTFEFDDVSPGSYLLTVQCHDYVFQPLRVDVTSGGDASDDRVVENVGAWQTFWGNEWGNKGEWRGGGPVLKGAESNRVAVQVWPNMMKDYYTERSSFSVFSFLKNPMILMGLFSLILIVGMPYLMENMDPETKAEFEEMQSKSPLGAASNPQNALANFDLAGWMAQKTSGGGEASNR